MRKNFRGVVTLSIWMVALLAAGGLSGLPMVSAEAAQQGTITVTGWLHVIHGDPPPESSAPPRLEILLADTAGDTLAELITDEAEARAFNGQYVEVTGEAGMSNQGAPDAGEGAPLNVIVSSITPAEGEMGAQGGDMGAQGVSGAQPFINLLCQFPNYPTTPHDSAWYAGLMGSDYPGLDHYWRAVSYNAINLNGSATMPDWVMLPLNRDSYLQTDGFMNLGKLAQDCTNAVDAAVHFPDYAGINLMFNAPLDGFAWGGTWILTLDGQTRVYPTTWMPSWITLATLAHEMGHGFGFPHSSGPSWNPPYNRAVYVSEWDMMSSASGTCGQIDPVYGCVPPGTITYHLDTAGWISDSRKVDVLPGISNQIITLEQLRQPPNGDSILMAKVPIGGSANHFYTVEARRQDGYDASTPGAGVIIHEVDRGLDTPNWDALVVVDGYDADFNVNGAKAMWLPGEMFNDMVNDIQIQVLSQTSTSFTVQISNNSDPILYPDAPTNVQITSMGSDSITITWDDNSFNEDGFRVYRSAGSGYGEHAVVGEDVTTYTDNGLGCGALYFYYVAAYNTHDERPSPFSVYGATFPCKPLLSAPANPAQLTSGRPLLTWISPGYSALTYEVYLDSNPTPTTLVATITTTAYQPPSPLLPGTYYWRIRARNDFGGQSPYSDVGTFSITSPPNAAPVPILFTTGTPELAWNRVSWAASYEIQVETSSTFAAPFAFSAIVPSDQHSVTTTPLTEGTYYWRVRGIAADGKPGAWSAAQRFVVAS